MGASGNPAKRAAAKKTVAPRKKVRLVKVLVQPVVMIDDGETLTEVPHPTLEIPASEWATYSSERFPRELAAWEDNLNTEDGES